MKALISPLETVVDHEWNPVGVRVAQVAEDEFPVAEPFYWVPCAEDVERDVYCYNEESQSIMLTPPPPPSPTPPPVPATVNELSEV